MAVTLTREARRLRAPGLPHLVGLDGLRAVAVVAVVLYHADVAWLPGGFLGVDVFFVLSGFLITSLLLVEVERTGRVDFAAFYLRRARRLLPALVAVLAVSALLVATVAYDGAATYRRDLPGSLLFFSNWASILGSTSYFEAIGRPPLLQHLWSLAVEEQFYLVWPLLCLGLHRWGGARRVGQVALGGAVASTMAMAVGSLVTGHPATGDPSRLYFGTDTHAMGILLGAALAVVWRPGRTSPVLRRQAQAVVAGLGVAGLVLLGWAFTSLGEYSTFLYRGGFLVVAGFAAVVVAAASHRGVPFGHWLGNPPLRWIGQRSYGIYLWHWPLFLVTRPGVDIPLAGTAALVARLLLLVGAAELSYRYLEMPVRSGALARAWRRLRAGAMLPPSRPVVVAVAAVTLALAGSAWRIVDAQPPSASAGEVPGAAALVPVQAGLARDFARQKAAEGLDPRARVSGFGDSVLIGVAPVLADTTFNLDLHARIGSQSDDVESQIRSVVAARELRDRVLIHTGTNGVLTADDLRGILDAVRSADRVVLVNVHVPRPWMSTNNKIIAKVAADFPNVVVADWAAAAKDHPDWFVADGVHVTPAGAKAYNALIAEAFGVPVDPSWRRAGGTGAGGSGGDP